MTVKISCIFSYISINLNACCGIVVTLDAIVDTNWNLQEISLKISFEPKVQKKIFLLCLYLHSTPDKCNKFLFMSLFRHVLQTSANPSILQQHQSSTKCTTSVPNHHNLSAHLWYKSIPMHLGHKRDKTPDCSLVH